MEPAIDPRHLLRKYGMRPKKSLGQNFMVGQRAIADVVRAADLRADDCVLEIGAGLGTLTAAMLPRVRRLIAIELDALLVHVLQAEMGQHPQLEIIAGDILHIDPSTLFNTPYKVVANIPYYITSAVLRHLLEAPIRPTLIVLTMQREVAQRIVANQRRSMLAVSVQFYGRPQIMAYVPRGAFFPPPKVDSAIVRIEVYPQPAVEVRDVNDFFRIVKAGFSAPRKQLRNALAHGLGIPSNQITILLNQAGISPERRAETLTLEEWALIQRILLPAGTEKGNGSSTTGSDGDEIQ